MAEISLVNTVNVSLSATPKGLSEANTASICIFSNEVASKSGEYFAPASPSEVATLFGSDSKTYAFASQILGQTPNIRTARGSLFIVPYVATDATRANLVTANLKSKISAFANITDGAIALRVNGVTKTATKLNFRGVATLQDIADVIISAGLDVEVTATETADSAILTLATNVYGTTGSISYQATAGGTDIGGTNYLGLASATSNTGANSVDTEALKDAILRMEDTLDYGGILTTQSLENAKILEVAETVQALDRLFFACTPSLDNISVLGASIKSGSLDKTRLVAYGSSVEGARKFVAGYASKALSPNFKASNTANTMNLKTISGVEADKALTQAYFNEAKKYGVDIYGATGGLSMVYSFDNGKYTDEAVGDLWLKKQIEVQVFNVLRQTNTKIAQTETGMTALKTAVERVCIMAVNNGLCGVGLSWNSADKFGNPEDFDRNIEEKGYYIYSLPVAQQDPAEREARIAPVIQIAIKRAGAIHSADLIVNLER